jgi:TonB family protein
MTKANSCRKFWCLLVALSYVSVGHAQDSHHKILKKGIQGDVRLKVIIKPSGDVKNTELIGGNPILAESAQKSVAQWKFSSGGSEAITEITVHFDAAAKPEN